MSHIERSPCMSKLSDFLATTGVSRDGTTFECERSMPTVSSGAIQGDFLNASVEIEGKEDIKCW
jgi:hypothetical protein